MLFRNNIISILVKEMKLFITFSIIVLLFGCQDVSPNRTGSIYDTQGQFYGPNRKDKFLSTEIQERNEIFRSDQSLQRVEYFKDSIIEKEGNYIRLLGGSSWILSFPSLALVTDDIIIVFQVNNTVAYIRGDEIPVKHVGGVYVTQIGYLTTVVRSLGDGAVLKLADGSLLSVPKYDQFDTGWWIPPYKALLTENKLYLYNLKKGKRVWIKPIE